MRLTVIVATGLAFILMCGNCHRERKAPKSVHLSSMATATFDMTVELRGSEVYVLFKPCRGMQGDPSVDALRVEKIGADNDELVCKYVAPDTSGVLRGAWRYGEVRQGLERCSPLVPAEYRITAVGSGTGESTFVIEGDGATQTIRVSSHGCG